MKPQTNPQNHATKAASPYNNGLPEATRLSPSDQP
jgi:hypothetical protein